MAWVVYVNPLFKKIPSLRLFLAYDQTHVCSELKSLINEFIYKDTKFFQSSVLVVFLGGILIRLVGFLDDILAGMPYTVELLF